MERKNDPSYIGEELDVFSNANNWKKWWSSLCAPYIHGRVLEVGSGTGINIATLLNAVKKSRKIDIPAIITEWVALEPDPELIRNIQHIKSLNSSIKLVTFNGYLKSLQQSLINSFDTILYIDVLEHIRDDREELERAWSYLSPGGYLIILVPARPEFYSNFDRAIGHYRRYTRLTLKQCLPEQALITQLGYLDFWGAVFPALNRIIRSTTPNLLTILIWDKLFIRLSRITNFLTYRLYGKSLLCVISKP